MEHGFIVQCPSCNIGIEILSIGCGIYRCAIFKDTGIQVNPHLSKEECERLLKNNLIFGCGKPFRITDKISPPVVCEYL